MTKKPLENNMNFTNVDGANIYLKLISLHILSTQNVHSMFFIGKQLVHIILNPTVLFIEHMAPTSKI